MSGSRLRVYARLLWLCGALLVLRAAPWYARRMSELGERERMLLDQLTRLDAARRLPQRTWLFEVRDSLVGGAPVSGSAGSAAGDLASWTSEQGLASGVAFDMIAPVVDTTATARSLWSASVSAEGWADIGALTTLLALIAGSSRLVRVASMTVTAPGTSRADEAERLRIRLSVEGLYRPESAPR
ncbi:MAG: hypothetical protein IT361_06055 [Gemmatimonadaceae bacterium]|nr:hypothetical protein [Gemmatimonadaceae bacterium]